ncbi:MAG: LuxR C-terminal-related transcriptional regulator [Coriobacteriales bacterium]|nr:LuxR C-terminal-related transcriptional regulator [Coriobacteriales bacterium]
MLHTGGILMTLLLVILFRHWLSSKIKSRVFSVVVAAAATIGTLIAESSDLLGSTPDILAIIGTLLTACSTGALLSLWGEGYRRVGSRAMQAKVTMAAMSCCFAIYLLISVFPKIISLALVSTFPLLSVFCLYKIIRVEINGTKPAALASNTATTNRLRLSGRPDQALLRLMLYIALCSIPVKYLGIFFADQTDMTTSTDHTVVYSITLFVFLGAIALEALLRKSNTSALPVLIGVLVTIGVPLYFFLDAPTFVVRTFMSSGYLLFVAAFYSYLGANSLADKRAPFLIFAFGNCANTFGMACGWTIGHLANTYLLSIAAYIAVVIVYVVLFVGLFLLSTRQNAFTDTTDNPQGKTAAAETSRNVFLDGVFVQGSVVAGRYGLSSREEEILKLLVRGRNVSTVAKEIGLSRNTVKTHTEHIYKKLDVHTREELLLRMESE